MTIKDLREKAYKALVNRGVRHPMPDQVVEEMKRIANDGHDLFDRVFR